MWETVGVLPTVSIYVVTDFRDLAILQLEKPWSIEVSNKWSRLHVPQGHAWSRQVELLIQSPLSDSAHNLLNLQWTLKSPLKLAVSKVDTALQWADMLI